MTWTPAKSGYACMCVALQVDKKKKKNDADYVLSGTCLLQNAFPKRSRPADLARPHNHITVDPKFKIAPHSRGNISWYLNIAGRICITDYNYVYELIMRVLFVNLMPRISDSIFH